MAVRRTSPEPFPISIATREKAGSWKSREEAGLCVENPPPECPMAKSLGIVPSPTCDEDGWIDILVANDTVQNFLFHNQGERHLRRGRVVDRRRLRHAAAMPAAPWGSTPPFRNNQAIGVAIGNFANEMTALYVSLWERDAFHGRSHFLGTGPQYSAGTDLRRVLLRLRSGRTPRPVCRQWAFGGGY